MLYQKYPPPLRKSFAYAFSGIRRVALRERNFRLHLAAATVVFVCGVVFRITFVEWGVVFLAIGMVLSLEVVNTCIETLCDLVKPDKHGTIRRIKDMAAGAVLIASLASAATGLVIFGPYVWNWLMRVIGSK